MVVRIDTLGKIGREAMPAVPALERAKADPDDAVRDEAARTLELLRGTR